MRYTRNRAIRLKCYDCSCFNRAEIKQCTVKTCALYPYRMGKEIKADFTEPKGYKKFIGAKTDEEQTATMPRSTSGQQKSGTFNDYY